MSLGFLAALKTRQRVSLLFQECERAELVVGVSFAKNTLFGLSKMHAGADVEEEGMKAEGA